MFKGMQQPKTDITEKNILYNAKQLRSYQANVATAIIMQYAIKPILNGDIHSIYNKKWIGFRYPVFYDIFPCCYHIITICVDTQNKWQNQNDGNKPKKAV